MKRDLALIALVLIMAFIVSGAHAMENHAFWQDIPPLPMASSR